MGNVCDKVRNDKELGSYMGRKVELRKARDLLKAGIIRVLGIFGIPSMGKSRFLSELLPDTDIDIGTVTYYDFELDDVKDCECQYEWLNSFYARFGTDDDIAKLRKCFPDGTSQCGQCENCSGHKNRCSKWKIEIIRAVKCLNKRQQDTLLVLDNIDQLVVATEGIKEDFLDFLQMLSSKTKVQVIVTSTNKIKLQNRFEPILLDVIDEEASLDLLYEKVEIGKDHTIGNDNGISIRRCYNVDNKVFTPGNERCIRVIARLCEGLPLALNICGDLLTEDNNLITPAEAVQLLILSRVHVLSPENAPSSDRLDLHKEQIKQLKKTYRNFYEHLNMKMTSDGCTIQEANPGTVPDAHMKQYLIRPLINQSLVSHKDQKLHVHGVLSECVTLLQAASLSVNPNEAQVWLKRCIKETAKLSSLDIPDSCLNDARQLDIYIHDCFPEAYQENGRGRGNEKTSDFCQPEYSSTVGPRAISYQKETFEGSDKMLELVLDRDIDTGEEQAPNLDKTMIFSQHRTADDTERLNDLHLNIDDYRSELGSIVCQPDA